MKMASAWMMTGVIVMAGTVHGAQPWRPAEGPLMTPWAKDVSPDRVWPEYPRPQMVRKDWVNLNGLWRYAIRPKAEAKPNLWDGDILVPFAVESALSGVMKPLKPDQRLWYHRSFQLPPNSGGQRLLLHFGAVDWQCTVWVSGREVGQHSGGYDPFTLDITDALRAGENDLDLAVWDPTDTGHQPHGKQVLKPGGIMYTAVSGIWQTVWLEVVPANYIQSLAVVPDVDRGTVSVTVQSSAPAMVKLAARRGSLPVAQAGGTAGKAIELKIPDPNLWSPERPTLYDLEVSLVRAGKVLDTVTSYFGLRKIEVRKDAEGINRLLLNGRPLFQYGLLDQGWWPDGLYTAPSDEALRYDLATAKRLGMNMARKHVKAEPARWYYWCDRLGLLVWQDMPSGDAGRSDEAKADFRREFKAIIDTLHNFPCIVMWTCFNEGWGQHDTAEIAAWVGAYDPTRLVNEGSGCQDRGAGAISDLHSYPGPSMRPVEQKRACVLGEFGGLGMPVAGHTWQAEKNWGYVSFNTAADLTDAYVGLLIRTRPLIAQGLCGAVYTQTSDTEVEVNGLMTYDRGLIKMDPNHLAAAAAKLYLPPPRTVTLVATSEAEPQTWRYTLEPPASDWFRPEFDDAAWRSGPGGFGAQAAPGSVLKTTWNTSDLWLRCSFNLDAAVDKGDLCLNIHHSGDGAVYLNGQRVKRFSGLVAGYSPVGLDAKSLLRAGQNTLAVHCRQTTAGPYIDVGLTMLIDQP